MPVRSFMRPTISQCSGSAGAAGARSAAARAAVAAFTVAEITAVDGSGNCPATSPASVEQREDGAVAGVCGAADDTAPVIAGVAALKTTAHVAAAVNAAIIFDISGGKYSLVVRRGDGRRATLD